MSNRPLYMQVRDNVADRIAAGAWKSGRSIPNEADLARELGVSQGTVRKGLDLLVSERVLTRRQGRGTFVNDLSSQELADRFSNLYTTDGRRLGGMVKTLEIELGSASEDEERRLHLSRGDQVYRVARVRFHEGKSFMFEEASLPAGLFPGLVERNLPSHRLVEVAPVYRILLGKAEERVSLGTCSPSAVKALNQPNGTHALILDRILKTLDGRPAEWRRGEFIPNGMHYLAEMK